ncbi:MAG: GNAT family N-acetyltransferase [Aestuariibacter sp.]
MLQYRSALTDDVPQLLKLEQCVVEAERPFNTAIKAGKPVYYDLPALIADDNALLLVADSCGEIVGTGYGQILKSKVSLNHDYHCYLGFMYVAPDNRGQGVNQEIIQRITKWSKSRGVNDFYLDVYAGNEPAIKAYQKSGFIPNMLEMKLHL